MHTLRTSKSNLSVIIMLDFRVQLLMVMAFNWNISAVENERKEVIFHRSVILVKIRALYILPKLKISIYIFYQCSDFLKIFVNYISKNSPLLFKKCKGSDNNTTSDDDCSCLLKASSTTCVVS
jgi:hypothetical protein